MALKEWGQLLAQVLLVIAMLAYGKVVRADDHNLAGTSLMSSSEATSWRP